MRAVVSISMSKKKQYKLKKRAKKAGLTVSAYVLKLIDEEEKMISEDEILEMAEIAHKEYLEGKTIPVKSGADLLKQLKNEDFND